MTNFASTVSSLDYSVSIINAVLPGDLDINREQQRLQSNTIETRALWRRIIRFQRARLKRLIFFFAAFGLSGCATYRSDFLPDGDTIGVPFSSVGTYGNGIGVPNYRLNGKGSGYANGWGLSGTSCCILLPKKIVPVIVTVTWETYRSDVDERINHTATIPVNFAVSAGDSSGLYVHFLPGHKVELWVSWLPPENSDYPGPKYPRKPGPRYMPLAGEKVLADLVIKKPVGSNE